MTKSIGARDRLPAMASARRRADSGAIEGGETRGETGDSAVAGPKHSSAPDFVHCPAPRCPTDSPFAIPPSPPYPARTVDRFAFQLGSLTVTWYGICLATGFYLGTWTAARRAPRVGVSSDSVWDLLWVLLLAGVIGARAWYVVSYWDRDFRNQPLSEIFMIHHGGLVFHGGFVLAALCGFAWCARRGVPAWRMADILTPSLVLGHAFGRLGCFINGCCYGRRCELPWAIRYPAQYQLPDAALHPVQLYEAALDLALMGALVWVFRRRRFEGQVFALYLIGYALLRSFVELYRGDYPVDAVRLGFLTPAHWVSAGLLVLGLALYLLRRRHPLATPVPAAAPPPSGSDTQTP